MELHTYSTCILWGQGASLAVPPASKIWRSSFHSLSRKGPQFCDLQGCPAAVMHSSISPFRLPYIQSSPCYRRRNHQAKTDKQIWQPQNEVPHFWQPGILGGWTALFCLLRALRRRLQAGSCMGLGRPTFFHRVHPVPIQPTDYGNPKQYSSINHRMCTLLHDAKFGTPAEQNMGSRTSSSPLITVWNPVRQRRLKYCGLLNSIRVLARSLLTGFKTFLKRTHRLRNTGLSSCTWDPRAVYKIIYINGYQPALSRPAVSRM